MSKHTPLTEELKVSIINIDAEAMHYFQDIVFKFLPKGNVLDCGDTWMYRSDDKKILFDINKENGKWWLNGSIIHSTGLTSLISFINRTSEPASALVLAYELKLSNEFNFIASEGVRYE